MIVRCQHEVYLQPKMFETIGFHHQGSYNISAQVYHKSCLNFHKNYAFPIIFKDKTHLSIKNSPLHHRVVEQKMQYHTNKFDVSFNEQQFVFNGGCRFILETQSKQQEKQSNNHENDHHNQNEIHLVLRLFKHNLIQDQTVKSINKDKEKEKEKNKEKYIKKPNSQNDGMHSTENIVKSVLQSQPQQQSRTQKKQVKQKDGKIKNNKKKIEQVSQIFIKIDISVNCISNSKSIYQTVTFSQQQYFGKLFYLINYVKLGYKIRPHIYRLEHFSKKFNNQALERKICEHKISHNPLIADEKNEKCKQLKIQPNQLFELLTSKYPNVCQFYMQYIRDQIIELNKQIQIQNDFIKMIQKQLAQARHLQLERLKMPNIQLNKNHIRVTDDILSSIMNKNITNNQMKQTKDLINLSISLPDQQIYYSWKTLCQYYQCQTTQQLYLIIFQQNRKLTQFLTLKWHSVLNYMNGQKWCASYFHKTILNFKNETQLIKTNRIQNSLGVYKQFTQYNPKFRYKYYIHQGLPCFYMKKTMTKNKQLIETSPQNILFVLVHGFNGNQHDMNRIKSFIGFYSSPHLLVLKKISTKIQETLDIIGKTAAEQIAQYMKVRPFIKRINFIGFSLGGVIIRACLPYLKQYHQYFNLLITLSSPHLGVKYINSCIVKTGMQVLHRLKGIKNIKQLLLNQKQQKRVISQNQINSGIIHNKQPEICQESLTYLQKLSHDPNINSFNLVIACGAEEDKYVPGFSATLDYDGDNQRIIKMMNKLKGNIRNLHQIYVKFDPKKQGTLWDRVSGRRVHINFLDDDSFLHFFLAQYFHIF